MYKVNLMTKVADYPSAIGSSYTEGNPSWPNGCDAYYLDVGGTCEIIWTYEVKESGTWKTVNAVLTISDVTVPAKLFVYTQVGSNDQVNNKISSPFLIDGCIFSDQSGGSYRMKRVVTKAGAEVDNIDQVNPISRAFGNYYYGGIGYTGYVNWTLRNLSDYRNFSIIAQGAEINVYGYELPHLTSSTTSYWSNYHKMLLYSLSNGVDPEEIDTDDPYDGIPESGPDGGGGDFDDSSDPIDFPSLPSVSVADSGMCTIYKPSLADLKLLNTYLWEDTSSGGINERAFKENMKANIMECFMGLSLIPCIVPATNTKTLNIGNIATPYTYPVVDSQFVDVDMGTLTIKTGTGGTYLDYAPYTKAQIFLPFIGFNDIDIDEIMNKTLTLRYRFDVISGSCMAFLKCGSSVLYQFAGNCQLSIPLTGGDYRQMISAGISTVLHGVQTAAGVGAALAGTVTANPLMAGAGAASALNGYAGLASDTMNSKVNPTRSGVVSGNAGIMSYHYAYIVLTRPDVIKPKNQYKLMGYPSYIFKTCAELTGKGFTSFSELKMDGVTLTQSEKEELAGILKGGAYL